VDEEAALEQAVKFCQVHMGASAQKQVSSVKSLAACNKLLLVSLYDQVCCRVFAAIRNIYFPCIVVI